MAKSRDWKQKREEDRLRREEDRLKEKEAKRKQKEEKKARMWVHALSLSLLQFLMHIHVYFLCALVYLSHSTSGGGRIRLRCVTDLGHTASAAAAHASIVAVAGRRRDRRGGREREDRRTAREGGAP